MTLASSATYFKTTLIWTLCRGTRRIELNRTESDLVEVEQQVCEPDRGCEVVEDVAEAKANLQTKIEFRFGWHFP